MAQQRDPKLQRRLLTPFLLKKAPPVPDESERKSFPSLVNLPLWVFFTWVFPILATGYKRTIQPEDLPRVSDELRVENMAARFLVVFNGKLELERQNHIAKKLKERGETIDTNSVPADTDLDDFKPSRLLLVKCTFKAFKWEFVWATIAQMLGQSAQVCNPLLSRKLITYVEKRNAGFPESVGRGVGLAIGVSVLVFTAELLSVQGNFFGSLIGSQTRSLFSKLLLEKSFRIDTKTRRSYPPSKITSLMSTDLSRMEFGLTTFAIFVSFPVPLGVAIGILIYNIHAPAMVGVGVMLFLMVFVAIMGSILFRNRTLAQKLTDARVGYMTELLTNLKMIKFYSWEMPYFLLVRRTREREMLYTWRIQTIRSLIVTLAVSMNLVASMTAFLTLYAIASSTSRDPAAIFSSLSLFNTLAIVFVQIPLAMATAIDALIASFRVGKFLAASEIKEKPQRLLSEKEEAELRDTNSAIIVRDALFEWEDFDASDDEEADDGSKDDDQIKREAKEKKKAKKWAAKAAKKAKKNGTIIEKESAPPKQTFKLFNINLDVKKGEFVVFTGLIGSGKSSLLHAIEGVMKKLSGDVMVGGSLLVCGTPWLQNATVRDNIVFGLEYDREWYRKVISACCLNSDLEILPAGDKTEIGERGINLSGGQKARICLARTVYTNRDIILLDDVLSAVDSKVGQHIMQQCVHGLLAGKTRILATHQLSLIGSASQVIYLNGDGTIEKGTVKELLASSPGFRELMAHDHTKEEAEDDEDDFVLESEKNKAYLTTDETATETDSEQFDEKQLVARQITWHTVISEKDEDEEFEGPSGRFTEEEERQGRTATGHLITDEEKSINAIGFYVYKVYVQYGLSKYKFGWILPLVILGTVGSTFFSLFTNTWLSFWISEKWKRSDGYYIGLYIAFTFISVLMTALQFTTLTAFTNSAAKMLNIQAVSRVLHVPMSYMDTTPLGRIINRFTKDTDTLDNQIGSQIDMTVYFVSSIIGTLVLSMIYLPWFAIAVPFLILIFVLVAIYYQASGREVKRLEAVQRSHVYNNFNETLSGLSTIKAFGMSSNFLKTNLNTLNVLNEAMYSTLAMRNWLNVYMSLTASSVTVIISFLSVFRVFHIKAASVGLLLSYVLEIAGMTSSTVSIYTVLEQEMNSTERVIDYVQKIPQEAPYHISETVPAPEWPQHGSIEFRNVDLAYRDGLPLTLKNMNAVIKPSEKIGICGRTGAGKSSIMVALYRLSELRHGEILIDGVDIRRLGLHELRSRLSIIPQDPVLFKGTIRKNLDPFDTKTDEQLWDTLVRAGIIDREIIDEVKLQDKKGGELHKFHLDFEVMDGGENFSLGEKQLVAFARALVRGTKILILDEATSSVDLATDTKLQEAISREFKECTILCIAHRLNTILNYDRVMVMESGEIAEFDTPKALYKKGGIFTQMCEKSSIKL